MVVKVVKAGKCRGGGEGDGGEEEGREAVMDL